jgi:hypothetical protein
MWAHITSPASREDDRCFAAMYELVFYVPNLSEH